MGEIFDVIFKDFSEAEFKKFLSLYQRFCKEGLMVLAEMGVWTVEYGEFIDNEQKQLGSVVIMAPTKAEALRRAPLAMGCGTYTWIDAYPS